MEKSLKPIMNGWKLCRCIITCLYSMHLAGLLWLFDDVFDGPAFESFTTVPKNRKPQTNVRKIYVMILGVKCTCTIKHQQ